MTQPPEGAGRPPLDERLAASAAAQRPIIEDLRRQGLDVGSLSELVNGPNVYDDVLPVLLSWVERADPSIRALVVRALTVPAARRCGAGTVLLREFERSNDPMYKWTVGNALAVTATADEGDRIRHLFADRRHGMARQQLAGALARLRPPGTYETLVDALDDDDVRPHAVEALGVLKDVRALPRLRALQADPNALVARTARAAVKKIERSAASDRTQR